VISIKSSEDLSNLEYKKAIKKPIIVKSWKMSSDFELIVGGVSIRGYADDYVISTLHGYMYICDKEIFNEEYEFID